MKWIYAIIFLILINCAAGATVHGTIYNFYLEEQQDAVVLVNSTPRQIQVAKDGRYTFELGNGEYEIEGREIISNITKSYAKETIKITKEGDYIVDLILFPIIDEEENVEIELKELNESKLNYIILVVVVAGFGLIIYLIIKSLKVLKEVTEEVEKTTKEEEKDLVKEILKYIKEQGGRASQKDIRKRFPSSEAKISLVITELEHKGVVEKIKKGRGNIIIIK